MKMVVYNGAQYPADKLPPGADRGKAVDADLWYSQNARPPSHKSRTSSTSRSPAAPKGRRRRPNIKQGG